ncbi:Transducin/WD40 repeat-like superfamily protein [Euphorbia peplus]|nr:Transducin/WD40 repeat-like superfamily protein [Euphorbia peplus]
MASRFQATPLVAAPLYPNAIAWSDDNLLAVACAQFITILNPALPFGPRDLITVPACEPYPIGVVKRQDLLAGSLLSAALSRDRRPCVRSISWSPTGMASNSGCLLAVCTTEGRVKVFRPPFCDFCAEWIEVIDISDKLYDYLASTNLMESNVPASIASPEQTTELASTDGGTHVFPNSIITRKQTKQRHNEAANCINKVSKSFGGSPIAMIEEQLPIVVETKLDKKRKYIPQSCSLPQIAVQQYASRSAMLSSIVVSWSPVLCLPTDLAPQNNSSLKFSILAVGGRSGQISLWKIALPDCYSIEHSRVPSVVTFVGLLQAHYSWVTAVNWALLGSKSNRRVLLASGSSDGSVKIWLGNSEKLMESSQFDGVPFFLLKEVISANLVPVSVLSLVAPVQALEKMLIAVGKGSGSFEVWEYGMSSCKFDKVGCNDAHDYVVTGLAWAFDGNCLYSCGQDNYVRCWNFRENSLYEVPLPSNTLGLRSSTDLPDIFLSCHGVAVSPGNLVLAVVRNLDVDQLDHMYEARAQKAIVEFFWIGGQQLDIFSDKSVKLGDATLLEHSAEKLDNWEFNVLWSLNFVENLDKPLVVWDIIATLLAFKQCMPEYLDHILAKWLSFTYVDTHENLSIDEVLAGILRNFSTIGSRQLQLLNIISRCLVLSELTSDEISRKVYREEPFGVAKHQTLWIEILLRSEKELRARLVALSFLALSSKTFCRSSTWRPSGVAQMAQWVQLNHDDVRDQLKVLTSGVQKLKRREVARDVKELGKNIVHALGDSQLSLETWKKATILNYLDRFMAIGSSEWFKDDLTQKDGFFSIKVLSSMLKA